NKTNLLPGVYAVTGGPQKNSALSGTGVVVYFGPTASLDFGNGAWSISAPTSGTYNDIAIFVDRANTGVINVGGGPLWSNTGGFYAPSATLSVHGNPGQL